MNAWTGPPFCLLPFTLLQRAAGRGLGDYLNDIGPVVEARWRRSGRRPREVEDGRQPDVDRGAALGSAQTTWPATAADGSISRWLVGEPSSNGVSGSAAGTCQPESAGRGGGTGRTVRGGKVDACAIQSSAVTPAFESRSMRWVRGTSAPVGGRGGTRRGQARVRPVRRGRWDVPGHRRQLPGRRGRAVARRVPGRAARRLRRRDEVHQRRHTGAGQRHGHRQQPKDDDHGPGGKPAPVEHRLRRRVPVHFPDQLTPMEEILRGLTTPPCAPSTTPTGCRSPAPSTSSAARSPPRRRFPGRLACAITTTLAGILERLLPPRRRRSNPRVIKRKMSNWAVKRAEHYNPPEPPDPTITIVAATKPARTNHRSRHLSNRYLA